LIVFLEASRIVSNERGSTLLALSGSEPDAAQTLLARSTGLRDSLRKIFGAMVGKEAIAPDWTDPINRILRITEGHDELVSADSGWKLEFVARESGLDWLLAAVARSAAEIIVEGAQARVRICANPCAASFSAITRDPSAALVLHGCLRKPQQSRQFRPPPHFLIQCSRDFTYLGGSPFAHGS